MIELDVFKQKLEEDKEHLPLLTLDEFLTGIRRKITLRRINGGGRTGESSEL